MYRLDVLVMHMSCVVLIAAVFSRKPTSFSLIFIQKLPMYCSITRHTLTIYLLARARDTQPLADMNERDGECANKMPERVRYHLPLEKNKKNAIIHVVFENGLFEQVSFCISYHRTCECDAPHTGSFNEQNKQRSRKRVSACVREPSHRVRMCSIVACCAQWKSFGRARTLFGDRLSMP